MNADELLKTSKNLRSLNDNMRELMNGIPNSGQSYEQIQQLNTGMSTLPELVFVKSFPRHAAPCCFKDSDRRKADFWSNWTWTQEYAEIYEIPRGCRISPRFRQHFADIHPSEYLYRNGINEKGLFIELNNGSHPNPITIRRENSVAVLAEALNQCSTVDEREIYRRYPGRHSYIIPPPTPKNASQLNAYPWLRIRTEIRKAACGIIHLCPDLSADGRAACRRRRPIETDRASKPGEHREFRCLYGKVNVDVMKTLMARRRFTAEQTTAVRFAGHRGSLRHDALAPRVRLLDWQQVD
jgi:hypothetical protein